MRIRSLEFENFRQHQSLHLDLDGPGSDFVVIHGENGEGKTNLLNGVLWCFYGTEGSSSEADKKSDSLVSRSTQDVSEPGDSIRVRVHVNLEFSEGMRASVERSQVFKVDAKSVKPLGKSQLVIVTSTDGGAADASSVPDPEAWLDEKFPQRLRQYFLFDGEELDSFFSTPGAERTVEDAVLQVTQIDILTRVIERLRSSRHALEKEAGAKSTGGGITLLTQELETLSADELTISEEIKELEAQAAKFAADYKTIESDIKKLLEEAEKRSEYEAAAAKQAELEKQLEEAKLDHAIWAARVGSLHMLKPQILSGLDFVKQKRAKGEVPAPIKPEALKELLAKGLCICGNHLEKGSDARSSIDNLLAKNAEIDASGEEILEFETALHVSSKFCEGIRDQGERWTARVVDLTAECGVNQERVNALHKQVAATKNGEERLSSLQEVQRAQAANQGKIASRKLNLKAKQDAIAAKQVELEKAMKKDDALRDVAGQISFTDELIHLSEEIFEELSNQVRGDAEEVLDREFKKMIWKKDYVQSVKITKGFLVEVFDNRGFEILSTLSAGENACLAFSFALALNKVSGYEMPMIIDTPLGRMSPDVQTQVAKALADNTKSTQGATSQQVILLMTGTEYNDDVKDAVKARKPLGFRLKFDTETSMSSLEVAK